MVDTRVKKEVNVTVSGLSTSAGILVDALSARPTSDSAGRELVDLRLALSDVPLALQLAVPDASIRLSELLPLARLLCSQIMGSAKRQAAAHGQRVFCRKGCSACCHYLVPLSVPEAMSLYEHVERLPAPRRRNVLRVFTTVAEKILGGGEPQFHEGDSHVDEERRVAEWYVKLNLSCPFLREEACLIYALRPLACREHLSLTPPSSCTDHSDSIGRRLTPSMSMVTCLAEVTAEVEQREVESIMMPLSVHWAKGNLARVRRSWPAAVLVKLLAEKVMSSLS